MKKAFDETNYVYKLKADYSAVHAITNVQTHVHSHQILPLQTKVDTWTYKPHTCQNVI
jgi:hypothetical protein